MTVPYYNVKCAKNSGHYLDTTLLALVHNITILKQTNLFYRAFLTPLIPRYVYGLFPSIPELSKRRLHYPTVEYTAFHQILA